MPNVIYTVRPDGLLREADSIERSAKESQKSWIMLGQLDKYSNAMQEANLLRRAAAEKSVYTRREILRNAGYTVKTPKALSKNPKTRNIEGATMATKKFSPAQIAAQKLFAERARAGTLGKGKRKANPEPYNPYASRNMLEEYSEKTDAQLRYIIKDAGAAAVAQRGMQSEMKYLDQVNDANTVLYRRSKGLNEITGSKIAKMKIERSETPDNPEGMVVTEAGALRFAKQNMPSDLKKAGFVASVFPGARGWVINYGKSVGKRKTNPDKSKPRAYVMRASQATGRPPVKGTKAGNRLITRRKKALAAPAGYFPNPEPSHDFARIGKPFAFDGRTWKVSQYSHNGKTIEAYTTDRKKFVRREFDVSELMSSRRKTNPTAAMITGYQVICMHPKKHVVGIFKTMAEAKLVARAMADAKGVAYGVKTVKVHKTHFAV